MAFLANYNQKEIPQNFQQEMGQMRPEAPSFFGNSYEEEEEEGGDYGPYPYPYPYSPGQGQGQGQGFGGGRPFQAPQEVPFSRAGVPPPGGTWGHSSQWIAKFEDFTFKYLDYLFRTPDLMASEADPAASQQQEEIINGLLEEIERIESEMDEAQIAQVLPLMANLTFLRKQNFQWINTSELQNMLNSFRKQTQSQANRNLGMTLQLQGIVDFVDNIRKYAEFSLQAGTENHPGRYYEDSQRIANNASQCAEGRPLPPAGDDFFDIEELRRIINDDEIQEYTKTVTLHRNCEQKPYKCDPCAQPCQNVNPCGQCTDPRPPCIKKKRVIPRCCRRPRSPPCCPCPPEPRDDEPWCPLVVQGSSLCPENFPSVTYFPRIRELNLPLTRIFQTPPRCCFEPPNCTRDYRIKCCKDKKKCRPVPCCAWREPERFFPKICLPKKCCKPCVPKCKPCVPECEPIPKPCQEGCLSKPCPDYLSKPCPCGCSKRPKPCKAYVSKPCPCGCSSQNRRQKQKQQNYYYQTQPQSQPSVAAPANSDNDDNYNSEYTYNQYELEPYGGDQGQGQNQAVESFIDEQYEISQMDPTHAKILSKMQLEGQVTVEEIMSSLKMTPQTLQASLAGEQLDPEVMRFAQGLLQALETMKFTNNNQRK